MDSLMRLIQYSDRLASCGRCLSCRKSADECSWAAAAAPAAPAGAASLTLVLNVLTIVQGEDTPVSPSSAPPLNCCVGRGARPEMRRVLQGRGFPRSASVTLSTARINPVERLDGPIPSMDVRKRVAAYGECHAALAR